MKIIQIENSILINEDCLKAMDFLIEKGIKVDAIIADIPYGTTACKWDSVIPFESMWSCLNKLIKDNGAICLFGSEPFSSLLRSSNLSMFKYDWYWNKKHNSGYVNAKLKPMSCMEVISVFSRGKTSNGNKNNMVYNPQGLVPFNKVTRRGNKKGKENSFWRPSNSENSNFQEFTNYPRNYIEFEYQSKAIHPTQKPVALMEYLVKTYTNENELVLDFTMGSGTTGVACQNTNRKFIGIEWNPSRNKEGNLIEPDKYFNIGVKRMQDNLERLKNVSN